MEEKNPENQSMRMCMTQTGSQINCKLNFENLSRKGRQDNLQIIWCCQKWGTNCPVEMCN